MLARSMASSLAATGWRGAKPRRRRKYENMSTTPASLEKVRFESREVPAVSGGFYPILRRDALLQTPARNRFGRIDWCSKFLVGHDLFGNPAFASGSPPWVSLFRIAL
jgi:hypothetical protein